MTTTITKSATCCRCLRWHKREELTGDHFCPRCVGGGSLRGAKCRWCRGNLTIPEGSKEPKSSTCENCAKLQIRYGPPQHCKLCKLEAAFKVKRGSQVCRRCDYCAKNYGKPQTCQKCKVMAAWEGDKIEKINDMRLCFICSFREKRRGTKIFDKDKENENKTKETKTEKPKEQIEDKILTKEEKTLAVIVDIKCSAVMEEIDYDAHTSASLATNELTSKLKEMNCELQKRKKIIDEKDVTIAHLKGLITSKMTQHENERRNWEARIASRVAGFNIQISKLNDELQTLKYEKRADKKKKKEKKFKKKGHTVMSNDPDTVKMELFSNTLKRPAKETEEAALPKKAKKEAKDTTPIKEESPIKKSMKRPADFDSDSDNEIDTSKKQNDANQNDETTTNDFETIDEKVTDEEETSEPKKTVPDSGSDTDDVEAALKEIDEEEKGYLANSIDQNSKDSSSDNAEPNETTENKHGREEPIENDSPENEPTESDLIENEPTENEPTDDEPTDNEPTDNEPTDNDPTDNEPTYKEPIYKEPTDSKNGSSSSESGNEKEEKPEGENEVDEENFDQDKTLTPRKSSPPPRGKPADFSSSESEDETTEKKNDSAGEDDDDKDMPEMKSDLLEDLKLAEEEDSD